MRVLLVDDTDSIRYSVKRILEFEKIGCEVAEDVQNGLEIIEKAALENRYFDVVLLDLLMPGLPVKDLVERLNTDPCFGFPKLVIFSAYQTAHEHAQAMGTHGCLMKPFTIEQLLEEIHRVTGFASAFSILQPTTQLG